MHFPTIAASGAAQRHITPTPAPLSIEAIFVDDTPVDLDAIRALIDRIDDCGLEKQADDSIECRSPLYAEADAANAVSVSPAGTVRIALHGITGKGVNIIAAADDWIATAGMTSAIIAGAATLDPLDVNDGQRGDDFDRDFDAHRVRDLLAEVSDLSAEQHRNPLVDPLAPIYRTVRQVGSIRPHQGAHFMAAHGLIGNGPTPDDAAKNWLHLARQAVA